MQSIDIFVKNIDILIAFHLFAFQAQYSQQTTNLIFNNTASTVLTLILGTQSGFLSEYQCCDSRQSIVLFSFHLLFRSSLIYSSCVFLVSGDRIKVTTLINVLRYSLENVSKNYGQNKIYSCIYHGFPNVFNLETDQGI